MKWRYYVSIILVYIGFILVVNLTLVGCSDGPSTSNPNDPNRAHGLTRQDDRTNPQNGMELGTPVDPSNPQDCPAGYIKFNNRLYTEQEFGRTVTSSYISDVRKRGPKPGLQDVEAWVTRFEAFRYRSVLRRHPQYQSEFMRMFADYRHWYLEVSPFSIDGAVEVCPMPPPAPDMDVMEGEYEGEDDGDGDMPSSDCHHHDCERASSVHRERLKPSTRWLD